MFWEIENHQELGALDPAGLRSMKVWLIALEDVVIEPSDGQPLGK